MLSVASWRCVKKPGTGLGIPRRRGEGGFRFGEIAGGVDAPVRLGRRQESEGPTVRLRRVTRV